MEASRVFLLTLLFTTASTFPTEHGGREDEIVFSGRSLTGAGSGGMCPCPSDETLYGCFKPTPSTELDGHSRDLSGVASLTRVAGGTAVSAKVDGLRSANFMYIVHVHTLPCDVESGGPHYMIEPMDTNVEANELWLRLTPNSNDDGGFSDLVFFDHTAGDDAQSLIVHDPSTGKRIACATLENSKPKRCD